METFEAIRARKSVRRYQDRPVEAEKIRKIVEAGYMAAGTPMAGKVYFNAISNKELLKQISEGTKERMRKSGNPQLEKLGANEKYDPIYGAPVAIVVSTDIDDQPMVQAMATQNAACAAQNMLIAATDLGLGSCYLMTPTMAFDILKIHDAAKLPILGAQAVCVVVAGYTDDTTPHKAYPEDPEEVEYVE